MLGRHPERAHHRADDRRDARRCAEHRWSSRCGGRRAGRPAGVRDADHRGQAAGGLAPARRDRRRGHVLHLRHHRPPQGRRLHAPRALPALPRPGDGRRCSASPRATSSCTSCRCSTPTRGACRSPGSWSARPRSSAAPTRSRATSVEIIHAEKVTFVGAVPTVWIAVKELVEKEGYDISSIRCIPIGGSAAPRTCIEHFDKKFGASMLHAWGMTEMTPAGHRQPAQELHGRAGRRSSSTRYAPSRATPSVGRRHADRGRQRARAAVGRREHGRDPGARAVGHPAPTTTIPSRPTASPPTAGSAPATSPRSTPRATSRSPTAPRT